MERSPSTARFGRRVVGRLLRSVTAVSILSGGALAALSSLAAPAAQAATFTVTTTADSGPGSLRQAVASAASGDTITFAAGLTGTINLDSFIEISTNVTISGPGASTIAVSGQDSSGVFIVDGGVSATITGITIENGLFPLGGGIDNLGNLTATQDVFINNRAASGGAISECGFAVGGPLQPDVTECGFSGPISSGAIAPVAPVATLSDDAFIDNNASQDGGAIYSGSPLANSLVVTDDLFEGNTASNEGGAIITCPSCSFIPGPFQPSQGTAATSESGPLVISAAVTNSTFWANFGFGQTDDTTTGGGAIYNEGTGLTITNATFAQNSPDAVANGFTSATETNILGSILAQSQSPFSNCDGTGINDGGYNVSDDNSCGFSAPSLSNQPDNAIFGPSPAPQLANNGGPTQTVAIPSTSVGASLVANCTNIGLPNDAFGLPTDQRGYQRPSANCSAGAYQVNGVPPFPPGGGGGGLAPSSPVNLTGVDGQITLNWSPPISQGSSPVTSYEVYRFTATTAASQVATVSAPTTTFVDTNVAAGVTYSYYVEATNAFGNSPPSNVVSVTAPAGPTGTCSTYSGSAAFVCALYEDLLGRAPDSAGLNNWLAAMSSGASTTQVAYAIASSTENRTNFIQADYQAFLGRPADPGGISTWLAAFNAGATDEQVDAGILGSAEFFSDSGSTNSGFVNAVYQDLLGRPADPGGLSAWTTALSNGVTRTQVAYGIDTSNESRTDIVEALYQFLLNRPADPGGLSTWLAAFNAGGTDEQVIAGIAGSQEFYNDATGA